MFHLLGDVLIIPGYMNNKNCEVFFSIATKVDLKENHHITIKIINTVLDYFKKVTDQKFMICYIDSKSFKKNNRLWVAAGHICGGSRRQCNERLGNSKRGDALYALVPAVDRHNCRET